MGKQQETSKNAPCPCGSLKTYGDCCGLYHDGGLLPDPLSLMRSRYSAYALGLAPYLIATTHPLNPRYQKDHKAWTKEILEFNHQTQFLNLEILEVVPKRDSDGIAIVTFKVTLKQGDRDVSFSERSYFKELEGRWLYLNGDIIEGNR